MEKEIIKEYSNGELTVLWKPGLCIYAAECVKHLPNVYDPQSKPWIKIENASNEELKSQISKCPSGALSYFMDEEKNREDAKKISSETQIKILANGPLLVIGTILVTGIDGESVVKKETSAFCRCGASSNKPYCDGSHNGINFKG